jgi:adenosylmethionine-8-amino-7-oxononanoate aminotransferase
MSNFVVPSIKVVPNIGKSYPTISHGKGVYLYDKAGKRYLDGISGTAAVCNIGHGDEEVAAVMKEQAAKVSNYPTFCFNDDVLENYLKNLLDFAPEGFAKGWTASSGTEAVENAVKYALQYHHLRGDKARYKILSRTGSYHGNSLFMLDVGGMMFRRSHFERLFNNFSHCAPAYCYRCAYNQRPDSCKQECASSFEDAILKEGPESVAAIVIEPIVGAALGGVPAPREYFVKLREICDRHGVLLIADEVLTGFGRVGSNFAITNFGITPDLIALGKGITGGYFPFSAFIAHKKVSRVFDDTKGVFWATHTYVCNTLGAAVAESVLDIIKRKELVNNAAIQGSSLMVKLQKLRELDIVGDIRGRGLLIGVEFVKDKITKAPYSKMHNLSNRICDKAIENGLILYPGNGTVDGMLGDHLLIMPPLTINEEEIDTIVNILYDSIASVQREL